MSEQEIPCGVSAQDVASIRIAAVGKRLVSHQLWQTVRVFPRINRKRVHGQLGNSGRIKISNATVIGTARQSVSRKIIKLACELTKFFEAKKAE